MKIYVVSGSTGEYSDRTDWMVCAYADEEAAKAVVTEYSAMAKEIAVRMKLPPENPLHIGYGNRWKSDFKWPHPDPSFQIDYTGTEYMYCEIDLVTTGDSER